MVSDEMKRKSLQMLDELDCSCVSVSERKGLTVGWKRGVADLWAFHENDPDVLRDAFVADKVVGKAAAALMVSAGVAELHTRVLSEPAARLLDECALPYTALKQVDHIVNRKGTDWCPLEKRCFDAADVASCLERIRDFMEEGTSLR